MKKNNKIFISGIFNILHSGHLKLFKFAKDKGSTLIVGVISDKISSRNAYIKEKDRLEAIKNCSLVDEVVTINNSVANTIKKLKPDIVLKGKEHESLENEELAPIKSYGGKLIFSSGETQYFSKDILSKEFTDIAQSVIKIPKNYLKRHKIETKKLKTQIRAFKQLKVCVIGDLIIDEYLFCKTLGLSNEEPSLVVSPLYKNRYLGGAGIVAAHSSALGSSVDFVTVAGSDEAYDFAKKELKKVGVKSFVEVDENRPTTLKQRYLSEDKTLLKVSYLHQTSISKKLQKKIYNQIKKNISKYDLIIFSDFNYGCLPQELVENIINLGIENKVFMVADSQSSSQIGNIARFKNMHLITPTELEARISEQNQEDGIVVISESLIKKSKTKHIILKSGSEGITIHQANNEFMLVKTDKLEALSSICKDSAGAGDSMLVGSSLILASKGSIWESALIGSVMSAIQVSRTGNIPISLKELLREIK